MRALYTTTSLPTTIPFPTINSSKLPNCHHASFSSPKPHKNPIFSPKQSKSRIPTKALTIKASIESSTAIDAAEDSNTKPFSVLFVCLGNICRSPAAEGVFTHLVKQRGLDSKFDIDSAGTINYHQGNQADPRMKAASKKRGIEITSRSRPIKPSDFKDFDLILAMDKQNKEDILSAFGKWSSREQFPADAAKKVRLMCSYCKKHDESEVPDPYYGGQQGFEKVLDLLEDACESLLDSILAENIHLQNS